jgi:Ubiquitin carboxyl-terminal hydrolase
VNIVFRITLRLGSLDTEKAFVRTFNPSTRDYGIQLPEKMLPQINLVLNDALIIECTIKENKRIQTSSSNLLGLINSGNLCYMNSFLQTLYNLAAFQKLIFKVIQKFIKLNNQVPHEKSNGNTSLLIALQRLFYNLKFSKKPVSTGELIVKSKSYE